MKGGIKMKKHFSVGLSACIGSVITIVTFILLQANFGEKEKTIRIEHLSSPMATGAVFSVNGDGEIIPLDFRETAKGAMESVVHIKSTQTNNVAGHQHGRYHNLPDPFRRHFGDQFFRDFFGSPHSFQFGIPQQRGPQVKVGTGSGVIVNSEGYIVTNNHVIANADDIEVTLHDNRTFKATVIGTDPSTDLALIQIKETGLTPVKLVNSDDVEVGEWVLAVGNPFNLNSTVTAGIVSAKARSINVLKDKSAIESFIQTDAAINPGNSGGALLNLQGGLIGINTAIASPTGSYAGYGFAVPSNIVNKVIEDLLAYGFVQRAYLGVTIRGLDGNLAKEIGIDITEGVYVDSVMSDGAASDAGIEAGDVILKVEDQKVTSASQLQEQIGRHRPGDNVTISLSRDGKEKTVKVKLKNLNGEAKILSKENYSVLDVLGATFEAIDDKLADKLMIHGGLKIKKLGDGKLKKHTQIKEGFIITKVDGKPINSKEDLEGALKNKQGGVMIEGVYEEIPGVYYFAFGL